jgi:Bifunctional DNA primase/polymerase, N-terminal
MGAIMTSPFGIAGPRLIERGYCALRIPRGLKHPNIPDWREEYTRRKPTQQEIDAWSASGAGVGIITGAASSDVVGVDVDTDDPAIIAAILAVLPTNGAIVKKRGQKGFTIFGRCPGLQGKAFNINGARVCDVLADGRFCVLPGSIHPDTGNPYRWLTDDALEDTDPAELPEYPADLVERIAGALAPFGYGAEPVRSARPAQEYTGNSGGDIWKGLNDKAIANLDAWVPQLGLYKLRRTRDGYQAVATWRPSSSGRQVERRKRNLGISTRGIRDFGDDRGYSPIDLVMAARGLDFGQAYDWLENILDPSDIVINLRPKLRTLKARHPAPIAANRGTKITVGAWGIKIGSWGIKRGNGNG